MIKVAIIGTGGISHAHIKGYLEFPERCKIVALVDIVPEKAEAIKKQYNLDEAKVYASHQAMLDDIVVDLADVCTPPFVHASISIDCMNRKVNVICEKPMAASLKECDAMLKARDDNGVKLSIIAQNRFRQPIADLKALIDSNIAGPVKAVHINSFWWRGHSYYDLWWRGTWEKEKGGCTLNHAVHHIDMLMWMMGLPESVSATLANVAHDNAEVEDLSMSTLKYPGALASVTASVVHHGEEQSLIFQCEKAKISAPYDCFASLPLENGFPEKRDEEIEGKINEFVKALPRVKWEGHTGQIENVLSAIENNSDVAIAGEDGRKTIEMICAIYKSGAEETRVKLPLQEDDPFYTVEGIMANVPHFYEKTASVDSFDGNITLGSDYKK